MDIKQMLATTQSGAYAYLWTAKLNDGTQVTQFEPELFKKLLETEQVIQGLDNLRTSVDKLDVKKVQEIYLIPSFNAKKAIPDLQPMRLHIELDKGEKFISYFMVDSHPTGGWKYYRHVLGISKLVNGAAVKMFMVVEPYGAVTFTTNENLSYGGE